MEKDYYSNLIKKYKELKEETGFKVQDSSRSGQYHAQLIDPNKLEEFRKVKEELDNCLEDLSDDDLRSLYNDGDYMDRSLGIIFKRKRS
jgi:hypothetical protein